MILLINTSSNHISIRSCLVSQPKHELILNNDQLFNATYLLPIIFGVILSPTSKNSTNSQIIPGTLDQNKKSKVSTIVQNNKLYKHYGHLWQGPLVLLL